MRIAYGWAMLAALAMLSFLPLAAPSPEEAGAMLRLGLTAAGSAVMLATPRRWRPFRRGLSLALAVYALVGAAYALADRQMGPSLALAASLWAGLIAGAVLAWRAPAPALHAA